jgi:hypothetical protein
MTYFIIGTQKNGRVTFFGKKSANSTEGYATDAKARKRAEELTSIVSYIVCLFASYTDAQKYCDDWNEKFA